MGNEPRPFVKWAGGKRRLLPVIDSIVNGAFSSGVRTYVEPFVGGGAVLFRVLSGGHGVKTVASDLNGDLITVYAVVRDRPGELNAMLKAMSDEYTPLGQEGRNAVFLKARERFNGGGLDPVETAALFIFLNKTCFNGLYRVNRSGAFNTPHGRYANPAIHDPDNILACSRALSGTGLLNFDYRETLRFASPETLYYLDPPYRPVSASASFTAYTPYGFSDADQKALREFCGDVDKAGGKFVMSNSDTGDRFFDNLYEGFCISRVTAPRSISSDGSGRKPVTEIIVSNF